MSGRDNRLGWRGWLEGALSGVAAFLALALLAVSWNAAMAGPVPAAADQYRRALTREATERFGLDAPIARLAAQIHQESAWRPDAESPYAQGLTQFTPATAQWIAKQFPDALWPADTWNPQWAIRAMVFYDHWLIERTALMADALCPRWAFALAGYNGGLGWVQRDRRVAMRHCADPGQWFGNVESFSERSAGAMRENREYVRRILIELEPRYIQSGWPGQATCRGP